MQNDRERMFLSSQAAYEVVRHTRTKRRDDAECEIEKRYACVEPLDQQHAAERDRVKDPLQPFHALLQNEDRDYARKYRRQILNRHRRRKRNILQRGEKEKESRCPEKPAQQKHFTVRSFPVSLSPVQARETQCGRKSAAKKDDFHRRN